MSGLAQVLSWGDLFKPYFYGGDPMRLVIKWNEDVTAGCPLVLEANNNHNKIK